ncbi:ATP-binding protein [Streptomyces sp. SD15]
MEDPPHRTTTPTDVSLVFPPHPVWVRAARETVRTLLTASHRPELTDTAVLLTSEAVTNAINACVHDEAPGLPTCRIPTPHEENGRGIQLISYGADAWGVCTHGPGPGKATWFELGQCEA